jgi:hypothetical protein
MRGTVFDFMDTVLRAQEKPLKRLNFLPRPPTRLKPGVNEKPTPLPRHFGRDGACPA